MKHLPKLTLILFIGLLLTSCSDSLNNTIEEIVAIEDDFMPIEINDEYVINIPKHMKVANDLNDDAALQYQNIFKETYLIVIGESKEVFVSEFKELGEYNDSLSVVENYRDIQLQFLSEGMDINMQSEAKSLKINGLDAEMIEIDAQVEGIVYGISYFLTFIEGEENIYMIMAWTLEDKKEKYKPEFEKSMQSFQLLDNTELSNESSEN